MGEQEYRDNKGLSPWAYPSTLIGYVRILLVIGALYNLEQPIFFVGLMALSVLLDLADGWVARRFGQEGRFGEVLDFGIDLITHTVLWVFSGFPFAPLMILLEWGAGFSVLRLSFSQPNHWKTALMSVHPFLRRYFAKRQRNVFAAWAVTSHFGFRIVWYLGYGETWVSDLMLPGIIVFEVVTAYMFWIPWRMRFDTGNPDGE